MTRESVSLADIQAAAQRIAGRVRRTPTVQAACLHAPTGPLDLWLKLENLQVTGSFKPRGAINCLLQLDPDRVARGIVTASGGNHGLAVAYAGRQAATRAVIYLPETTPSEKIEKLHQWGAEVVIEGTVWDEANRAALAHAEREDMALIHPFADPRVVAGQGTVGLEFLEDAPDLDLLVVAIGGGGLISGIATAAKAVMPGIRVVGVVENFRWEIPVSRHAVDSVNLYDQRLGLRQKIDEILSRCQIQAGRIDRESAQQGTAYRRQP